MLWSLVTQHSPPRLPARLPTTGLPSHRSGRGMSSNLPFPLPPPPPRPQSRQSRRQAAALQLVCSTAAVRGSDSLPPSGCPRALARTAIVEPSNQGECAPTVGPRRRPRQSGGGDVISHRGGKGSSVNKQRRPLGQVGGGAAKRGGKGLEPPAANSKQRGQQPHQPQPALRQGRPSLLCAPACRAGPALRKGRPSLLCAPAQRGTCAGGG